MIEQQRIIAQLKDGDPGGIQLVYTLYRSKCLSFLQSLGLTADECEDVYQDAIIALVENARKGKIDNLKSTLSTYLFAIAKFMSYRVLRNHKRHAALHEDLEIDDLILPDETASEWLDLEEEAEKPEVVQIRKHLERLGERCRSILKMAYFEGKSADEITAALGYPNKDVLKSQKSRCLRQLKSLLTREK